MCGDLVGKLQQVGKGQLGDRPGGIAWDVGHHNPLLCGIGGVEDVVAGCENADVLEIGAGVDHLVGNPRFVGQYDFSVSDPLDHLIRFGAVVVGDLSELVEIGQREVVSRKGVAVENDDFDKNSSFEIDWVFYLGFIKNWFRMRVRLYAGCQLSARGISRKRECAAVPAFPLCVVLRTLFDSLADAAQALLLAEQGADFNAAARGEPVSYTHLDVYKRQSMNSFR